MSGEVDSCLKARQQVYKKGGSRADSFLYELRLIERAFVSDEQHARDSQEAEGSQRQEHDLSGREFRAEGADAD